MCAIRLIERPFPCEQSAAFRLGLTPGIGLCLPGCSAPPGLDAQLALRPQRKVYTILIRHIKKNRIIFELNLPQIRVKLTINPIYIWKPLKYSWEIMLLVLVLCSDVAAVSGIITYIGWEVVSGQPKILASITDHLAGAARRLSDSLLGR